MGVTLKISKPLARDYFVSGETVSGTIELGSCRISKISCVNVYLEGQRPRGLHTGGDLANDVRRKIEHCS